jgi:two-component system sensor histidine kinase/response regulator
VTNQTRILLIDDDAVDRAAVRRALRKSGLEHTLTEASGGEEGQRLAAEMAFDCVLLDYRLPGIDTFALLKTLLAAEGDARAVLMLTGEADPELATRLMRAGALDYLDKAEVTPSGLARAIRYAEARRAFQAELAAARREAEAKSLELDTLNRQKSLLFSIIAHDLRNPFQALLGLSEVLGKAVAARDPASIERRAKGIHEAATQADAISSAMPSSSRCPAGPFPSRAARIGTTSRSPLRTPGSACRQARSTTCSGWTGGPPRTARLASGEAGSACCCVGTWSSDRAPC